ncbi:MAG: ribonuclease Y, partial [Candidatus Kapabacteria bacterium]|nr:ribonuclease Y [Candidatus Kapabacteria bacterium]
MNEALIIILSLAGAIAGFLLAYFISNKALAAKISLKISQAEQEAQNIKKEAELTANNIKKEKLLEVKEEWHRRKQEFENDANQKKQKLQAAEKQLKQREEAIEEKLNIISRKEKQLQAYDEEIARKEEQIKDKMLEVDKIIEEQIKVLEQISGLTREEAKKTLIDNYVNEAKAEAAVIIKQIKDEAKMNAQKEARNIIIEAIQRTAADHSVESTVSVVNLDSDEMKGRIIGREGRNIRAFEAATGIDLIIDDTPEAVVISGFDPFRREVAKVALEKLMVDGRIHPARIEEIVEKTKKELEDDIIRIGENTILELGLHNMHPELVRLIGKMKYRSSYGQNLLNHSIEVAQLCGIMAIELDLDPKIAKRAGLLHDIGKCVEQNSEGPHALVGLEIAKKYKEHPIIANAIGAHHEDIEMESPYAV